MVKLLWGAMPWGLLCYFKITVCTCISPSVRRWFGNHLYFSKTTMSLQGLIFSHSYINHAVVSVLVTYLTGDDDSNISLPLAAIIANVQEGLSETMVIVFAHISDKYTGHFKMIIFINAAYFVGMLLLLLGAITSNRNMFYGAVVLISLGEAGRSATLSEFLHHQYDLKQRKGREDTNEKRHKTRKEALWSIPWFLGAVVVVIHAVAGLKWEQIFIFSISILGISTLWFCFGRFYNYFKSYSNSTMEQEQVEELGTIKELTIGHVEKQRWDEQAEGEKFWSFRTLRQLPKKVIKIIPMCLIFVLCSMIDVQQADIGEDEDKQGGELGRHTEVGTSPVEQAAEGERFWTLKKLKEEKYFLKIFSFCSTFLVYSIVLAAGSTFFFEQQSNLDHLPNNFAIYLSALSSLSRYITSYLCWLLIRNKWRHANVVRIGCGMTCSILCCISAWQLEKHRLSVVQKNNQEEVLSTIWLVPQFVLLGLMEGLAEDGLINVLADQARADKLVERYASHICDFVLGIGKLATALIVFAFSRRWLVANTNEKEKIRSWFKKDINASRLDKYYLFLTFLSLANLFYYVFIAFFHLSTKGISDKSVNEENKEKMKDVLAVDNCLQLQRANTSGEV